MGGLSALRIPLFLLGSVIVFIAERYLGTYGFYKYAIGVGLFIDVFAALLTFLLYKRSLAQGFPRRSQVMAPGLGLEGACHPWHWSLFRLPMADRFKSQS